MSFYTRPLDVETKQEGGRLRSGRRFQSGKRRRTTTRRGSCIMIRGEEYKLALHFDEGSCDEEKEYHPIPETEEEEEAPDPYCK